MKLTQSEENGRILVTISGKCTVEHAAALREALLAATSPGKPVTLDLAEVEDADITLLQLLLATAQTLEKRGTGLSRQGALSPAVGEAARISGFDQTPRLKSFFAGAG
jgi:anti-anti-sigma regulatory factor